MKARRARSLWGPAGARPTWTRVRDTSERTQAAIGASSQGPAGLSPSLVTLNHLKNKSINHRRTHLIIFTVHFHTSSVVSIISLVLKTALLKIHVLHGATSVLSVCSCWCFSGAFYVLCTLRTGQYSQLENFAVVQCTHVKVILNKKLFLSYRAIGSCFCHPVSSCNKQSRTVVVGHRSSRSLETVWTELCKQAAGRPAEKWKGCTFVYIHKSVQTSDAPIMKCKCLKHELINEVDR